MAVRQVVIAVMVLCCQALSVCFWRNEGRKAVNTSLTSVRCSIHPVNWVWNGFDAVSLHVEVDQSRVNITVPHQLLNRYQINTRLEQVRGKTVAQ